MAPIYSKLTELIGNTPLLELTDYNRQNAVKASLIAKLVSFSPFSSLNAIIFIFMIVEAKTNGNTTHYTFTNQTKTLIIYLLYPLPDPY